MASLVALVRNDRLRSGNLGNQGRRLRAVVDLASHDLKHDGQPAGIYTIHMAKALTL